MDGYKCQSSKKLIKDFCYIIWDETVEKAPCIQYENCVEVSTTISPETTSVFSTSTISPNPDVKYDYGWIVGVTIACIAALAVLTGLGYFLFRKYRTLRMRYRRNLPDGTENRFSLMLENSVEPENLIEL